jgi:hypothetical protein
MNRASHLKERFSFFSALLCRLIQE